MGSTATGSMGVMLMNVTWFGSSAMLKASELVAGVNANMVGSVCPGTMVAAVSHGKLTEVGWTKTGLMAGPMVLDVVGVVNMVLSGSVLTREGGSLVGTVVLMGGCDTLTLCITSLVVGVGALWGIAHRPLGSMILLVACSSLHVSLLSSNSGSLGIPAQSLDLMYASCWGLCSLPLELDSSASFLTL